MLWWQFYQWPCLARSLSSRCAGLLLFLIDADVSFHLSIYYPKCLQISLSGIQDISQSSNGDWKFLWIYIAEVGVGVEFLPACDCSLINGSDSESSTESRFDDYIGFTMGSQLILGLQSFPQLFNKGSRLTFGYECLFLYNSAVWWSLSEDDYTTFLSESIREYHK